jgi:NAD(P)-dependent dehydrogenase (short-subunit alcohol dehydrogenase family)
MISSVSLNAEYVILGATGNTGSIIADSLLSKGKKVRVVGRDAERLERFVRKGAEAFIGDGKMLPPPVGPLPLKVLNLEGVGVALLKTVRCFDRLKIDFTHGSIARSCR